jgi:hypothetical protein
VGYSAATHQRSSAIVSLLERSLFALFLRNYRKRFYYVGMIKRKVDELE